MHRDIGRHIIRYLVAVLAVGLTIPVKFFLRHKFHMGENNEQEAPFMLSLGSVMIAGWYGGLGPGLLATALTGFTGSYFFMGPEFSFDVRTPAQKVRLILLLIEGTLISVLAQSLKSALRRAEANEQETRGLQRELLDITDSEQRRIGHDLHDGLGQHLTGIAFMSKLVEQRLGTKSPPEAQEMQKINALVNKAIGWTRDLARGLAPVDLDREEGLASALRSMTDSVSDMFEPTCRFEMIGEYPVRDPTVAIHLYRIAQEALSNAIKHAKPRSVHIQMIREPDRATIRIQDDGRGFDPEHVESDGMGLRIMNYRAKMIAGQLTVRSTPGKGTIVSCACPLRHTQEEPHVADENGERVESPNTARG